MGKKCQISQASHSRRTLSVDLGFVTWTYVRVLVIEEPFYDLFAWTYLFTTPLNPIDSGRRLTGQPRDICYWTRTSWFSSRATRLPAFSTFMSTSPTFDPTQSPVNRFAIPEAPSRNLRAFLQYVAVAQSLDVEGTLDFFDESLEHRIIPNSLGRPVLNKRQYGEYLRGAMRFFRRIKVTINQVIEADNIITAHLSSVGESECGTPYRNELILILHYALPPEDDDEALPKIQYAKEFVDSQSVSKFYTEERAKIKKMEAAQQHEQQ